VTRCTRTSEHESDEVDSDVVVSDEPVVVTVELVPPATAATDWTDARAAKEKSEYVGNRILLVVSENAPTH
jgi:hypothetical protein